MKIIKVLNTLNSDYLERILCNSVGNIGHTSCGFCIKHNKARFECGCNLRILNRKERFKEYISKKLHIKEIFSNQQIEKRFRFNQWLLSWSYLYMSLIEIISYNNFTSELPFDLQFKDYFLDD
jgi:hypothetical protein